MLNHSKLSVLNICLAVVVTGCAVVEGVADVTWGVAKFTGSTITGAVHLAQGKETMKLRRIGNSFFVDVIINKKVTGLFLVDTGASNVMISKRMAKKLNVDLKKTKPIKAKLASGNVTAARVVQLKELRVKGARVTNVPAVILMNENDSGTYDGLLGMSFLSQFTFQMDTQKGVLILQKRKQ